MSKSQTFILVLLTATMVVAALMLGNWSAQINPDGIAPHPGAGADSASGQTAPRNAFSFGVSMGLLGCSLVYCCLAFGLFISAKSRQIGVSQFTYWVAGLAAAGFVLSYLIDDYFY